MLRWHTKRRVRKGDLFFSCLLFVFFAFVLCAFIVGLFVIEDKSISIAVLPFAYLSYITFFAFKNNLERYTKQRQQKTITTNNQDNHM